MRRKFKALGSRHKSELILLLILLIAFLVLGAFRPEQFFTVKNLLSMGSQMPEFGIFTIAMMVVILTGGINLSVVTSGTFPSIIGAMVLTTSLSLEQPLLGIVLALLVMLVLAALAGILNGYFVAYIGLPALLGTLGTSAIFEGIGLNVTKGGSISGFPDAFMQIGNGHFLGLPIPLWLYVVLIVLCYLVLDRGIWGIHLHMVGSNPIATQYSGINIRKVIFKAFLFSAFVSMIAGLIMMSRYNSAKSDYGSSYLMQSVTAAVLGGTNIYGGEGSVLGTVIAVAIIQVVTSGLNIIGLDRNLVDIAIGTILILVLALRYFTQLRADQKLIRQRREEHVKASQA